MLSHFFRKLRPPKATEPLETRRANGQIWHFRPGVAPLLGGVPDIEEWERRGLATLVKKNLQRSIWRVALPGSAVYLKLCRTNTPRAWIRDILRPPKARLEFENALALQSCGIGCTEPLAWGMSDGLWPGSSYIITREQVNAEPLDLFLANPLTPQRRRQLAVAFGEYLAKLRDAGVSHPDAHPGNFLIEWLASPKFCLLDVHAVHFGTVSGNLVLLNRWFQMRTTRCDRLRFWRAYTSSTSKSEPKELETQTHRSNLRFWQNRLPRYLGKNREYRKIRGPGIRGHAANELPEDLLSNWIANPDAIFHASSSTVIKDSRSSTVALFEHRGQKYIAKRFRRNRFINGIKNRLRHSPALRSWIFGQSLRDRGLPTARPLAVLQRYRDGLPREGYLIFEHIADAVELPDAVAQASWVERKQLIDSIGRLLRHVHERGVSHRDLKAPNILIAAGQPVLIDLVGVRLGLRVSFSERVRNLARLNASFVNSNFVSRTDRLRFLRVYLLWSSRDWKLVWRAIAAETLAKVDKNRRSGRVLA